MKSNLQKFNYLIDPAFWYEDYPISLVGRRQSPINIASEKCILNNKQMKFSPELELSYPPLFGDLKLRNPKDTTYFGWRVDVPYDYGDQTGIHCQFFAYLNANVHFVKLQYYGVDR